MNTEYRAFFHDLRGRLLTGAIDYDGAVNEAKPIISKMNASGRDIAKAHNKRFYPFSFSSLVR